MALINRLSRLFKADLHAVLDHIEEPELLLNQSIREMEEDLAAQEKRHEGLALEQRRMAARRDEARESIARLEEELDVCFDSGKEDLARILIKRKLQAQRLHKRLDDGVDALVRSHAEHGERLARNRTVLEGMRQKAELFATRPARASEAGATDDGGYLAAADGVDEHDVEVAFLREKARRQRS